MTTFTIVVCALLGLIVGSFLNVVVYRVPLHESIVTPRSRCPGCAMPIAPRDNIPVLSWLILRGRCRHCGEPISPRYPLMELATCVTFAAIAARFGFDVVLPAYLVLGGGLLTLAAIDLEHRTLPNRILYPVAGTVLALLTVAAAVDGRWGSLLRAGAGAGLAFVSLFLIWFVYPKGMGFGDVRLAGLIGLGIGWLGLRQVAVGLFLGFLIGAVVGIGLVVAAGKSRKTRIPFGPFMALGALIAVLWGQDLVRLWLGSG
jgi:leader peptidase (prepilin peptidase)/N-methyltransferase